ncbi:hypothetical protein [Flexistipes sp.]|uniref:hypothetical protein n=1 Tax=Flexistipes sp. TaxID=3088135 RepID=UPI002E1DCA2B|nr:hypothetical protein [Flexistipes sp.]
MSKSKGRRQFTFTLYENNKKDSVVIKLLEKIPQSARGKVVRGIVLDAFADLSYGREQEELAVLEAKEISKSDEGASNKSKKHVPQKTTLQESEESEKVNKSNDNNDWAEGTDDINPFNGLNV